MSYLARHPRSHVVHLAIIAVVVATVSTACGGSDTSSDSTSTPTSPEVSSVQLVDSNGLKAALAERPEMPLINVHIPYEGHIDGTDAFIAFDSILESPDLPTDKSAPIALYCRSGSMSGRAAADLAEAGYTNVIDLEGGMNAWQVAENTLLDDPSAAG